MLVSVFFLCKWRCSPPPIHSEPTSPPASFSVRSVLGRPPRGQMRLLNNFALPRRDVLRLAPQSFRPLLAWLPVPGPVVPWSFSLWLMRMFANEEPAHNFVGIASWRSSGSCNTQQRAWKTGRVPRTAIQSNLGLIPLTRFSEPPLSKEIGRAKVRTRASTSALADCFLRRPDGARWPTTAHWPGCGRQWRAPWPEAFEPLKCRRPRVLRFTEGLGSVLFLL